MSSGSDKVIQQCREAIEKRIATSTSAEYARVALRHADTPVDQLAHLPKASRRVVVAARKRYLATTILDEISAHGQIRSDALITAWTTLHQQFPPPAKNPLAAAFARQMSASPQGFSRRTRTKKTTLSHLPRDWRHRVIARFGELRSHHLPAVAVLDAAGLRPEELRRGVVVTRDESGSVAIRLAASAKSRHGKAHTRTIIVDPAQSPGAAVLARALQRVPELHITASNKLALTNAIRRAGATLFGRADLTPYCFRHAFAADAKRSGLTGVEIARALGHSNDGLVPRYGAAAQGSNRRIRAESTREPKAEQAQQIARLRARDQNRSRSR